MIRNAYLSGSRLLLYLVLLGSALGATAQRAKPMKSTYQSFLDTQWWLGVRFGLNYTQPEPSTRLSTFSPIDYESAELKKDYNNFQDPGVHAGMDISFYHKGFSIALQPVYKRVNYSYTSEHVWTGDSEQDRFETTYEISQSLNFFEIPLILQYEFIKKGQIRPFVFTGLQYSILVSAGKDTKVTHTEFSSGSGESYSGGRFSFGVKDEFQNYYGALGGIGAAFDYFNVRTVLNASYMYSLSTVTDKSRAYQDNELSSLGEANDPIDLRNINMSLSLVFPLRYIDKTFQPY